MDMQELKQLIYKGEKVDIECKKAENSVPKSAYESYSAFANTKGGYIILGVKEDKTKTNPEERFILQGIDNQEKQKEDFWNTINGSKVNVNILKDEDVYVVDEDGISLIVIHVLELILICVRCILEKIHIREHIKEIMKVIIMQQSMKSEE